MNEDYHKSKATVILHVSTGGITNGPKIYDVFMHSVNFELSVSKAQVVIYSSVSAASAGIALSMGIGAPFALFVGGIGVIFGALQLRPHMPEFVEHAINMLMVETLKTSGWLIEDGIRYPKLVWRGAELREKDD